MDPNLAAKKYFTTKFVEAFDAAPAPKPGGAAYEAAWEGLRQHYVEPYDVLEMGAAPWNTDPFRAVEPHDALESPVAHHGAEERAVTFRDRKVSINSAKSTRPLWSPSSKEKS